MRVGSPEPPGKAPVSALAEQEAGLWSSLSLLAQPWAVLGSCEQVLVWGGASCSLLAPQAQRELCSG